MLLTRHLIESLNGQRQVVDAETVGRHSKVLRRDPQPGGAQSVVRISLAEDEADSALALEGLLEPLREL